MKHLLLFLLFSVFQTAVVAQALSVSGAVAMGTSITMANDHLVPDPLNGPLIEDNDTCSLPGFVAGLNGHSFATYCHVYSKQEGQLPQHHEVKSTIGSRAIIDGDNTSTIHIKWKHTGTNYATSDGHNARVLSDLSFAVNMQVTGLPPGTPVTVYWWFDIFGAGSTSHEDMSNEDSIFVINDMAIDGNPQFTNQFSFASPAGLPGWNEWKNVTGTFQVNSGANFNFSVSSVLRLYLNPPAGPGGFGFGIDQNDGIFKGDIYFTVVPQYPAPENNDEDMYTLFSLDIGSDTEFSDPKQDGNEYFDPGDLYVKSQIGPLPFVAPYRNDYHIFGYDPDPKNIAPIGPAPVLSGLSIDILRSQFFDLDGADLISANLSQMIGADPLNASIAWFADSCLFEAEYLYLSFDDDTPPNYASAIPPSVPVTSTSPSLAWIYSDAGVQDEIQEFDLGSTPVSGVYFQDTVDSEVQLHPNLAPDPLLNNDQDDDVDALDMIYYYNDTTPCNQYYFSCDHEATSFDPVSGIELNPGTIYRRVGSSPAPVITSIHHGLPDGTDIDGFEFAWVWDQNEGRFGLALIFSVDDDDPLTPANDESGGLNPNMLYFSFMDGNYHDFSAHQLNDDIDAIAVWKHSLNGTQAFPNPVWGTKIWRGTINASWNHSLNWFPRGVPFDPEDVTIPAVMPSPVIGTSGLDCKSISLEPGATVKVNPGINFIIKGL